MKSSSVTIQMKATEQYLSVVLLINAVVVVFELNCLNEFTTVYTFISSQSA